GDNIEARAKKEGPAEDLRASPLSSRARGSSISRTPRRYQPRHVSASNHLGTHRRCFPGAARSRCLPPGTARRMRTPGSPGDRILRSSRIKPSSAADALDELLEAVRIANGKVREHLAVEIDPGLLQAVDEFAIADAAGAAGGVDAHDPQSAPIALLLPAVLRRVGIGATSHFLCGAPKLASSADETLDAPHHAVLLAMASYMTTGTRHEW